MTKVLKYIGIFIAIIAGLLILAVAVINLIPGDKYKNFISSGVKSATGRDLEIEGELDIKLFSTFAFKASGIKFTNADWGSKPHMASVGAIEAEVALFPLLKGILDVTLLVDAPEVLLETHSSGQGNWEFIELMEAAGEEVAEAAKTVEQIEESVQEAQSVGGFPLRLRIRKVVIKRTRIAYLDGTSGDQMTIDKEKLIIERVDDRLALELSGKFNDMPLALSGGFDNAEFFVNNQPAPVSFDGHFGDVKLAIRGTAGPLEPTFDLDVSINLNTDSVAVFSPLAGQDLPDIGPLAVSAKLIGKDGKYAVSDLLATLEDKTIMADVKASIADLVTLNGLNLEANVSTDQLTETLRTVGFQSEFSLPDSFQAEVVAEGSLEDLTVTQFQAKIQGQGLSVDATGQVKNIMTLEGISADVLLNTESLDYIAEIAQTELPPLGPLKATANITSTGEHPGRLEIKADLNGDSIHADVAGSIEDPVNLAGINADINFSVDSLASLDDLVKQELPASGPVTLEVKIDSKDGLEAPTHIDTVIKSDGFKTSITGSIAEPMAARGIDLALNVEAESMQQVGKLTGIEFVSTEPMKLVGKFTSNKNSYQLAGLHLKVGELDAKGEAAFQQPVEPGDRPRVSAVLHVGKLDYSKRQKARLEAAEETGETPENVEVKADDEGQKKKVFSSDPLPWGPLRKIDADIEVTVETVKTLQLNLEQVIAEMRLDNGLLTLNPLQAKVGNGTFGGTATLDARNSPAALVADIELSDATFRDFGGKVNFLVDLKGSGNSVAEIMAGLDGHLQFDVRDATLKKSLMTGFGTGLLSSLNPFTKDEENTELICAIILFDIKDGIADANKTIAAQMTDVTWFGSGEINLITEEIDFGLTPKPRKGLGVSLGGLAKLAHLGGTLAQPKVELDAKDVAVKYGKYSAAVATGGLTLLTDIVFSRVQANADVCAAILEELDEIQEADENADENAEVKTDVKTEVKTEVKKSKRRSLLDSDDDYL